MQQIETRKYILTGSAVFHFHAFITIKIAYYLKLIL